MRNYFSRLLFKRRSKNSSTELTHTLNSDAATPIAVSIHLIESAIQYKQDTIRCYEGFKGKWGVVKRNKLGQFEELIPAVYTSATYLESHDLIVVNRFEGDKSFSHYFDTNGAQVITFEKYSRTQKYGNFIVIIDGKYGTINQNFQIEIPCVYNELTSLAKDIFMFSRFESEKAEGNKDIFGNGCGIVNSKNEILGFFPISHEIIPFLYRDSVIVRTDDMYSSDVEHFAYNIFAQEKTVLPFNQIYDTEDYHYHFGSQRFYRTVIEEEPGIVNFKSDRHDTQIYVIGKWGVALPNGETTIPNVYHYIERISADYFKFSNRFPIIEENPSREESFMRQTKWGLIDKNDTIILEAEFDWIIWVEDKNVFYLNKGGLVVWDERMHKPEWEVDGGAFVIFDPETKEIKEI